MLYNVAMFITYFIEMLIAYIFFSQLGKRKTNIQNCWLIGIVIFGIGALINIVFSNTVWLNILFFAIINSIFAYICFDISHIKAIFYSIILDAFCMSLEFASIFIISVITHTETTIYLEHMSFFILDVVISKTLYFLTCLILIQFIKRDKNNIKFPFSLYIYPIVVLCALVVFWYICANSQISNTNQVLLSLISASLFISIVILFITYQHNIEKENELFQLKSSLSKIETEHNYYDILEKQNQELLSYAHDAKNHLSAIKSLNSNPQIDDYINQMSESLATYSNVCHSGNHTLDVIVNKYVTECQIKNICFSFDVRLKNLIYINDYDLVTILSNILDNALEAAEKSKKKFIFLSTDSRNTYDVVMITNSCETQPLTDNAKLKTTKSDNQTHGIGLKNVKKILKKYNGDFDWEYDAQNKVFTSTVMLQNTDKL